MSAWGSPNWGFPMVLIIPSDTTIDPFAFDVTTALTYTHPAELTEHPIESGGVVTDNYHRKPRDIKFTGIVSNTPISEYILYRPQPVGQLADVLRFPAPINVVKEAHDYLRKLRNKAVPCRILSEMGDDDEMMLTELSAKKAEGDGAEFDCTWKKRIIVTTTTVQAPAPKVPAAAPKKNAGSQGVQSQPPTPAQKAAFGYQLLQKGGVNL